MRAVRQVPNLYLNPCYVKSLLLLYIFFWVFLRRQIKFCRRFGTLCQVHLQRLDEEYLIQNTKLNLTPGKYPKENIQDSEHGENLKSRSLLLLF
jgi:hypothetical protein